MKSNSSLFDVENLSVSTRSGLVLDGFLLIKKKKKCGEFGWRETRAFEGKKNI